MFQKNILIVILLMVSCSTALHKPVESVVDFDNLEKDVDESKTMSQEEKDALKAGIKAAKKQDEQKSTYIENLENKVDEQQEKNEKKSERLIDVSRKAGEADKSDKNQIFLYVGMFFLLLVGLGLIVWKFGNIFSPQKAAASTGATLMEEAAKKATGL